MNFVSERLFADVDTAVKKLMEIANAMPAEAGLIQIGPINLQFLAGGSVPEYRAARDAAIARGLYFLHPGRRRPVRVTDGFGPAARMRNLASLPANLAANRVFSNPSTYT
jgi:hypothetical protein